MSWGSYPPLRKSEKKKIIHYVSLKLLCASVNDFMKNESLNMVPCLSDK